MRNGFQFIVVAVVKNDALTKDTTPEELATILQDQIVASMGSLPWVLDIDVKEIG